MKNNLMKSAIIILILACIFAMTIAPVSAGAVSDGSENPPTLPVQFYGTLLDEKGQPFSAGTVLTAEVNDVISTFTLVEAGKFGGAGTFDDKLLVHGAANDDKITFGIQGTVAHTEYVMSSENKGVVSANIVINLAGNHPNWVVLNTLDSANAVTRAELGYAVSPENINQLTAPTLSRGGKYLSLVEKVVVKKKVGGVETVVDATVNDKGAVIINDGSVSGAESCAVNFVGRKIGDVTGDGTANTLDAARILQASANIITFDVASEFYGDVTKDGKTNTLDAARILQYSAHIVDEDYEVK